MDTLAIVGDNFSGMSNRVIDWGLARNGLKRSDVHLINLGDFPSRKTLADELQRYNITKVLALGAVAVEALGAPDGFQITKDRGVRFQSSVVPGVEVMPTPDPAFILRRISDKGGTAAGAMGLDFVEDLRRLKRTKREVPQVAVFVLDTVEAAISYLSRLQGDILFTYTHVEEEETLVTIDLETEGFDPLTDRILALGITHQESNAFIIPEEILYQPDVIRLLDQLVHTTGCALAGHNFRFDRKFLKGQLGVDARFMYDTMLLHWLLDERPGHHGLKTIVSQEWETPDYSEGIDWAIEQAKAQAKANKKRGEALSKISFRDVPTQTMYEYLARDIDYTYRLVDILWARVEKTDPDLLKLHEELLAPMQNVIADMELCGLPVNEEYRAEIRERLQKSMAQAKLWAQVNTHIIDFNPNSSQQLAKYLFETKHYPIIKHTPTGAPSTDEFVLKTLIRTVPGVADDPVLQAVMRYRKASKLLGTYVDGDDVVTGIDGRVHASINPIGTVTGRPSCGKPNLMNLPRPEDDPDAPNIRKMYVAPEGYDIVVVDYSQAEVRMLAWLSEDPKLCEWFNGDQDVHEMVTRFIKPDYDELNSNAATKAEAKKWRTAGKTANFSGVYNLFNAGSIHSLLEKRGIIMPRADVENFMADYKKLCGGLVSWMEGMQDWINNHGYVKTQFGNRRRFGIVNQDNREEAHKEGINTMAQGPACQLTWFSIIEIDKWLRETGIPAQIAMMVYDSTVLIARKDVAQAVGDKVADIMVQTAYAKLGTKVPFKADVSIGPSWGDAK